MGSVKITSGKACFIIHVYERAQVALVPAISKC